MSGVAYQWCFLTLLQEVQSHVERICEMGQVMRRAVQVDDQHYCSVRERLAQLEVNIVLHENQDGLFVLVCALVISL